MRANFIDYSISRLNSFKRALVNVFIFLPYYFSVANLLKTLFYPWKNIKSKKTGTGFSLQELSSRLSLNLVSRGIGFFLRVGIILVFVVVQSLFVIILPFFTIIYICLLPLSFLISSSQKTKDEIKNEQRAIFFKERMLGAENSKEVEVWFEIYYQHFLKKTDWSQLSNLFSYPPLARDWSSGFTPFLDQFASEPIMKSGHFERLIGRTNEISQIEQILAKSGFNNAILVGEEGVGKRTIIEGLASRIYRGTTLPALTYKRILEVDMTKIIATSLDEAVREQTINNLFSEAEEAKNIILLIPNIEKYIDSKSSINLTDVLEKFARSERLQIITATTPFIYEKYIFQNEKLAHVFSKVDVVEMESDEALRILEEKVFEIEAKSSCIVTFESLKETVTKSAFFITNIPFPEKAIELLDEACVVAAKNSAGKKKTVILPTMIDEVITAKTHIPINLSQSYKDKLLNLESLLKKRIVQQDEGIDKLSSMLRKSLVLSQTRKKPLASFLFLGPTGVGKTETAKAVHEIFFGSEAKMLRLDMSFYQIKEDVANLIGSPDQSNPGILTAAVRASPYGVLLIDEIEKASSDLLNIFLTVLDEGYFIDGAGKRVDCKNLMIIATSNAASDYFYSKSIDQADLNSDKMINYLIENHKFTAEFLNRFDGVILYKPLTKTSLELIARTKLDKIALEVFERQKIRLVFSPQFIQSLTSSSFDPKFGARNLDRSIRDLVEDKIATQVLSSSHTVTLMKF